MHQTFTSAAFFFALLLNGITAYTMESTFELLALPSELNQHISSYTDPETIGNLSITCHRLHEKISFQTPHIWDIVRHSIDCISDNKMPQLLIKVRLCKEHITSKNQKKILENIEAKILTRYDPTTFKSQCWESIVRNPIFFNPFLENQSSKKLIAQCPSLFSACFTNDTNIVTNHLCKDAKINRDDLLNLRKRLMEEEQILILAIIYKHYALLFEHEFTFKDFRWNIFFANVAMLNGKYKSFEMLVNHHKKYLNHVDINNMTYLDFLLTAQEEGLMRHGGIYYYEQNGKTTQFDLESMPIKYYKRYEIGQGDLITYSGAYTCHEENIKTDLKWMFKAKSSNQGLKKYRAAHDKCVSIVMDHGGTMTTETPEKCPPCIRRTSSKH